MSESDDMQFMDDQSDDGAGFEVFKNVGNAKAIKSVRVDLQMKNAKKKQHQSKSNAPTANEQAPRLRFARRHSDTSSNNSITLAEIPPFKRNLSSGSLGKTGRKPKHGPVVELNAQRRNSYNREAMGKSVRKGLSGKLKSLGFGRLNDRQKKILAESNFNDDQARAAAQPNQCNFLLATMVTGISYYYVISLGAILGWTCVCTYYMEQWNAQVALDEEEYADIKRWIHWFDETDVRMIGSLFVFSLVFRFNQCYNRWWQGRMLWGEIIQNCLDFSRKTTLWVRDKAFADRLNRYIVVFPYAAKAQLRGLSLTDESESGQSLVDRGFLTQDELEFLRENPCWEPEFFLDLMRATVAKIILAQWERAPDEQVLILPHSNRIHDRLFPPLDKAIYDLGNSIGEGVSVRSAGLPRSYDTVHYIFFWIYFLLAPMAEAATIGWLAPVVLGFSACIIMTLMDMGTAMVDPFGTDLVDLPIERFCETIEAQVLTIQRRHKTGNVLQFASWATPGKEFHDANRGGDALAYSSATISGLTH